MKNILLTTLALASACTLAFGQNFSGTVNYTIAIKDLPEGVPASMMDQFIPSKMIIYVKGDKMATTLNAGAMQHMIMNAKSDTAYMIMDETKTIYSIASDSPSQKDKENSKPVVVKTTSTEIIAGYLSTKYQVTTTMGNQKLNQEVWVTDKFKTPKPRVNASTYFFADIQGLMTRMTTSTMGMTMTVEATEISTTPPDDAVFKLPAGYARKPFTPQVMMESLKNMQGMQDMQGGQSR